MKVITNNTTDLFFLKEEIEKISYKEFLNNPQKVDLVYFNGGEDVSPIMYGEKSLPITYNNLKRDILEYRLYNEAIRLKIPCLGLCRGSQFLTSVQSKGKLIQDVENHTIMSFHLIKLLNEDKHIEVTSTHHQMMYPFNTKHQLIAISAPRLSSYYLSGENTKEVTEIIKKEGEPEIVYYPKTKCLGVQGHPEYITNYDHEFPKYVRKLIKNKLLS
jgi:putative glutamine amidotransferase